MRNLQLWSGLLASLAIAGAAHGQWSLNGTKVFYNTNNVGIGTNSPSHKLDVRSAGTRAVSAWAQAASGTTYGVYGLASSTSGRGVMGYANSTTGTAIGLYGQSASKAGYGVFGYAAATSGSTIGVYGQTASPTGRGVYALANATTGISYALYAKTNSAAGFAGYFIGGRNYFQGNVGIGTTNPVDKLHVEGTTRTKILKILGGADLAEPFDVCKKIATPEPGMVVVIDAENPGKLKVADQANDRRVAGIISGANGLSPGLVMQAEGQELVEGEHPVALTGRVWCLCDASNGAIEPGDLLTTSTTPGHAMKVSDHDKARGAIIGKAMTGLKEDRGLVLVLVSLQ